MHRSSVLSQSLSATLVAGAVGLAFVPTAHAQAVEIGSRDFDECWFDGAPHGRRFGRVDYGDVRIIYEDLENDRAGYGPRPIQVVGVIIPGMRVGQPRPTPLPSSGFNTESEDDVDPGHVIALHLGGPNVSFNVVPQWARWQRLEDWREMERALGRAANKIADDSRPTGGLPTRSILMNVAIEYKRTGNITPSLTTWSFPKAFYVTACVVNIANPANCIPGLPDILRNVKIEGGPPR